MTTNTVVRVWYHFEINGRKISDQFVDNLLTSATDYSSLQTILNNNGKNNGGRGTLVITSIGHGPVAPGGILS